MATYIQLYRNPHAIVIVKKLNESHRLWRASQLEEYWALNKQLGIFKAGDLPSGTESIEFESKQHDICVTSMRIYYTEEYLQKRGLTPLHTVFGFSSKEPEECYRVPNWLESLHLLRSIIDHLPKRHHKVPRIGTTHFQLLAGCEEMIQWILKHKNQEEFYLKWA